MLKTISKAGKLVNMLEPCCGFEVKLVQALFCLLYLSKVKLSALGGGQQLNKWFVVIKWISCIIVPPTPTCFEKFTKAISNTE